MKYAKIVFVSVVALILIGTSFFYRNAHPQIAFPDQRTPVSKNKMRTNAEWKKILTPAQYHILREAGTEVPFTGKLEYENRKGTYYSVGCNEPIFRSEQKYDSGTGWPSFWAPINPKALVLREDTSIPGESRTEVLDQCGGHLGHVFDDGPQPTGKRYCMNSEAMYFIPDKKQ